MAARVEIPLGKMEGQHLEFKSAAVLKDLDKVAREVVAMLNADGGEVWIGLREEGGRAMEIEPIPDAQSARSRLYDSLLDTLNPSPKADELAVEVVPLPGRGGAEESLVRIRVSGGLNRGPYSLVRGAWWSFPRRVGARLVPMTREEIREVMCGSTAAEGVVDAGQTRLIEWREEERREGLSGLWLGLLPVPALSLNLQAPLFEILATRPEESGNRRTGWNFARSRQSPLPTAQSIRWGYEGGPPGYELQAEVFEDGRARFVASFSVLSRSREEIHPLKLLEYPVSAFRILKRVYEDQAEREFTLLAEICLFGVGEWKLRPGSLGPGFEANELFPLQDGDDAVFVAPKRFSRSEVLGEPDRCGFRMVSRLYQAFGLRKEEMPLEYEERLVLPE